MNPKRIPPLVIFDLDGTLAESKQPLSGSMAEKLKRLLDATKVAVISGGALPQFLKQVIERLPSGSDFRNLYLLPTSGAALYEHADDAWKKIYEERLSENEALRIEAEMEEAAKRTGTIDFAQPSYGARIEYRGSQVTLSALGQQAPIAEKKAWDPDRSKRQALRLDLEGHLPGYLVRVGGATSIDVTKEGIDKAYGVRKLCERLGIPESAALYVGDELREGGNDEAVYKTAAATHEVRDSAETELLIEELLTTA